MTNMKDATLTASKTHNYVNPPFRQTVHVGRFPRSKMDAAREAYYNRPPELTSEEKYQGVAAAQRRKHRDAGTLTPSARAAQARTAAMKSTKSRAVLPPKATDRVQSRDGRRPRTERPRTDTLRLHRARMGTAGVASPPAPRLYVGPGAAPNVSQSHEAGNAAAAAATTRRAQAPNASPARTYAPSASAQPSLGSFATSFFSARSFLSRLSSGMSQTTNDASAPKVPTRGFLGWLSRWLGWT